MTDMCPVCRKSDRVEVLSLTSQGGVDIGVWICNHCRHLWRTEPWKLSDQITYYDAAPAGIRDILSAKKVNMFERFLQWADEVKSPSPRLMVDFGCASGTTMKIFKDHGWDVMGIEILPYLQKILDERNLPWAPSLKDSGLGLRSVDIVVMSDCIYYLSDPVGTLREIRSYLQPDGQLFLRHSTRAGLLRILLKVNKEKALSAQMWGSYVHIFSRQSTKLALEQTGFTSIRFLKEKGFQRSLKNEIIHRVLRMIDFLTLRFFDLTPTWVVVAKAGGKL